MNKFYVYVHRRLTDNKPFYVGKGSGNRAYSTNGRNRYWKSVRDKHGMRVEIVFENLTEEESFQCEIDTILEFKYFGYKLTNATTGGEGASGLKFTDQQRLNIANGTSGKVPWNKGLGKVHVIKDAARSENMKGWYKGINNPAADLNEYTFVRLSDGFEVCCTRSELVSNYNVDVGSIKKLFYKNPRKSAAGWKLKDNK